MQFNEHKSIYLQIADYMYDQILSGQWPDGQRIPSIKDLAVQMEVNPNTVTRTYTMLQDEGTLQNKRGIGYFTSDEARKMVLGKRRADFINHELPTIFNTMRQLGVTPEDLQELFRKQSKE